MIYEQNGKIFAKTQYLLYMKKLLLLLFFCYRGTGFAQEPAASLYKETFRPQYHFTTEKNWINDPNGLVYFDGEYHLFYQHNPFGNIWGHMTWGHAVSTDLVTWKHLPLAIHEENGIMIFSGTVIVDEKNSSGFAGTSGKVPMVAIYTGHQEGLNQSQHIAYSLDKGRTWTKYAKNPVLDLGKKDFRDPKVFWYEPEKKWVMVVVLPIEKKIQFYRSPNLLDWTFMSDFGPAGDTAGIWECPDLFQVPVNNNRKESKWVLMHSPAPYMQYFVGEFDGTRFKNETPANEILRPDYGSDYYAAIVYNNLPENTGPISIGWVNNWNYANDIPTNPWKGAMSLPRKLQVKKVKDKWIMVQAPVESLKKQRTSPVLFENRTINNSFALPDLGSSWEMEVHLTLSSSGRTGLRLGGKEKPVCLLFYDPSSKQIVLERGAGNQLKLAAFEKLNRYAVPVSTDDRKISMHIFFDKSIMEVYINEGETVLTTQVFPEEKNPLIELFSDSPGSYIKSLRTWKIKPVW